MNKERSVTPESVNNILSLVSLGATLSLIRSWYAGSNIGLINSFSKHVKAEKSQYFAAKGSPKINAVAWVSSRKGQSSAWVVIQLYRNMFTENADLHRKPFPHEIIKVHVAYNIKYSNGEPLHINHVSSVITNLSDTIEDATLLTFTCCCSRNFIACSYYSPRRCPVCRSGVKAPVSLRKSNKPFRLDLSRFKNNT